MFNILFKIFYSNIIIFRSKNIHENFFMVDLIEWNLIKMKYKWEA